MPSNDIYVSPLSQLSATTFSDVDDECSFSLHLRAGDRAPYPLRLQARSSQVKVAWLRQLQLLLEDSGEWRSAADGYRV